MEGKHIFAVVPVPLLACCLGGGGWWFGGLGAALVVTD